MQLKVCLRFICGLLAAPLVIALVGCSSSENIFGPGIVVTDTAGDADNFKLSITTDYNGTCPSTSIVFTMPRAGHLYFEVTNATGYHVVTLYDDVIEAGTHYVLWDGTNDDGEGIDSGIYLFHLVTEDYETWIASVYGIDIEDAGEE